MKVKYYFGKDETEFEYEPNTSEENQIEEMVKKSLISEAKSVGCESETEILKYLMAEYNIQLDDDMDIENIEPSEIYSEAIAEAIEKGYFEDSIKEICFNSAEAEFEDNESYRNNPLGYYGMSPRDFI